MAKDKKPSKIKTPFGDDMDYKTEKLNRKTPVDLKVEKELKKAASKPGKKKQ